MYLDGATHNVPVESLTKAHPRWKVISPDSFNLKLYGSDYNCSRNASGSRMMMHRLSTYVATYLLQSPSFDGIMNMLRSDFDLLNPIF